MLLVKSSLAGAAVIAIAAISNIGSARADTILWIDDTSGNIGQVDVTTQSVVAGSVHNTGQSLTDIGFVGTTLYGTTFTNLYSINTSTGAATSLGGYNVGAGGMNALVGNGASLLAASNATTNVYNVTPGSPGTSTTFKASPLSSAGDLAFSGTTLYEFAVNTNNRDALVNVTTGAIIGDFHVGSTFFSSVFGLADDGTTMYAVNGTDVYSVNLTNASLTLLFDYNSNGRGPLGDANGTAFMNENVSQTPIPGALPLFATGLGALGLFGKRRKRKAGALAAA